MDNPNHRNLIRKLGGWDRLVIFSGVLVSTVLYGLIGVAIFAILDDRPGSTFSIIIIIVSLLLLWAIIWIVLWLVTGVRETPTSDASRASLAGEHTELLQENIRLKKQLADLLAARNQP